jgi:hypothetical protein
VIKTSCEKCIFKLQRNGDQFGCYVGKLDKYIEKNEAVKENGNYTINRLCNSCRDTSKFSDLKKDANLVKEQNITNYYIFINCCDNDIIPNNTIESLCSLGYNNVTLHFLFNSGKFIDRYSSVNNLIGGNLKFRVSRIPKEETVDHTILSIINQIDKNYFIGFIDGGNELESNIFQDIDNKINTLLEPIMCYVDQSIVLIYNNMLSILSKQSGHSVDLDFYISSIFAWSETENKQELLWIKEYV